MSDKVSRDESLRAALVGIPRVSRAWGADPERFTPPRGNPDWELWRHYKQPEVWQAVALACDINPDRMDGDTLGGGTQEFRRLLRIAEANLGVPGGLPVVSRGGDIEPLPCHRFTVRISDFVAWLAGTGWPVSPGFTMAFQTPVDPPAAADARPAAVPSAASGPEWSTDVRLLDEKKDQGKAQSSLTVRLPHMTKTLEALFKFMRDHWTNFDPRNPPKSTVIAEDLDKALGWKAQKNGEPSRSAQTLAAAIRPDEIAEADQRNKQRRRSR